MSRSTAPITLLRLFSALPPPTITSIDLPLGDPVGGELRTLTGTNFTGATSVTVGGTAAIAFSVLSDTEMIVVMPAGAAHVPAAYRASASGVGVTSAAITITAAVGDLFLVTCQHDDPPTAPTITDDQGGAYVQIKDLIYSASYEHAYVYVRTTAVPLAASTIVTVTGGAGECLATVTAFSGMSKFGTSSIRSSGSAEDVNGGTPEATLSVAALTTNPTFGGVFSMITAPFVDAPTSWTERQDVDENSSYAVELVTRNSGFTGTTVTWGSSFLGFHADFILELDESYSGGSSVLVTTTGGTNAANSLYEYWSPASLSLTGFWDRGNYQDVTTGTWPGRASAGTSSGLDLTQGTAANRPAEVGLEPSLDGTTDYLTCATSLATLTPAAAGTIVALVTSEVSLAFSLGYDRPPVVSDTGGNLSVSFSASGWTLHMYDGGYKTATAAASASALHLVVARWTTGATIGIAVDGGAEVTTAVGTISAPSGARAGVNYNASQFLAGRIRTIALLDSKISNADATKFVQWAQACRGLES